MTKKTRPFLVGIDYSIQYPCICVYDTSLEFKFSNCKFYFHTEVLKYKLDVENISSEYSHKSKIVNHITSIERFVNLSSWAISHIPDNSSVLIEDYSFGSVGKVFNLAENVMCLKLRLLEAHRKRGVEFNFSPPKSIKKLAVGNGNANKQMMFDKFNELKECDNLQGILGVKKIESPLTDIVDAFFITKMLFDGYLINQ